MDARSLLCLVVISICTASAVADTQAILRCRVITLAAERLICYDAIRLPAATGEPAREGAAGAPARPDPASSFGLELRQAEAALDSIVSTIDGPFDGWVARSQLRLANGQVWEISDGSTAAYDMRNPGVRISRGVSGSFFMAIQGVAQTPRVRRVR